MISILLCLLVYTAHCSRNHQPETRHCIHPLAAGWYSPTSAPGSRVT
jgi:hypothetical protein